MAAYQIVYSNIVVREDISDLSTTDARQIEKTIISKLTIAPHQFGKPLRRPHQGFWVLRSGIYRIAYKIYGQTVRVLAILPRERIYEKLSERDF
jgi:mRNA-degrading endonuclease RelE of RelBE toxin-antitoxin system